MGIRSRTLHSEEHAHFIVHAHSFIISLLCQCGELLLGLAHLFLPLFPFLWIFLPSGVALTATYEVRRRCGTEVSQYTARKNISKSMHSWSPRGRLHSQFRQSVADGIEVTLW